MHQGSRAVAPVARHGNRDGHHVPYRPLPDHVPSSASRAVSPVAGHSVRDGRGVSPIAGSRVVSPVPDRVWYRPSLDHVSSCAVVSVAGSRAVEARRRIASRCVPARVGDLGVPAVFTVGHAARPSSAMPRPNIRLSPTPPTAVLRVVSHVNTVAFYRRPSGGAAQADRWAALNP